MSNFDVEGYNTLLQNTLALFKAVPVTDTKWECEVDSEYLLRNGIYISKNAREYGFFDKTTIETIVSCYGTDESRLNNFFHNTFNKIVTASDEQLYLEQILHYITTYDFEAKGIFDQNTVYVPQEAFDASEDIDEYTPYPLCVISGLTKYEIFTKIRKLLVSGVALSEDKIDRIMQVVDYYGLNLNIEEVNNKEVRCKLYLKTNTVPQSPTELLRLLYFVVTNKTTFINSDINRAQVMSICKTDSFVRANINRILEEYVKKYEVLPLARIFFRYKKMILCFKNSGNAHIINKVRRLATKHHVPCKKQILDRITSGEKIDMKELKQELEKVTVFKKVSLLNGIRYRELIKNEDKKVFAYKVRNGSLFIKEDTDGKDYKKNEAVYGTILNSVIKDVNKAVAGKKIYIPSDMEYAFPVSEKSFFGGIPYGSEYIFGGEAPVLVGVHWLNKGTEGKEIRVDLDVHGETANGSIGWNGDYRNEDRTVLYSGDMTNASIKDGGASEALYFDCKNSEDFLVTLDDYTWAYNMNGSESAKTDFDFFVGNTTPCKDSYGSKKILENQNLALHIPMCIKQAHNLLGFLHMNGAEKSFVFMNFMFGDSIDLYGELRVNLLTYMKNYADAQLKLNAVLSMCDVEFVDKPEEADIDLSLAVLSDTSILDLVIPEAE